MLEYGLNGQRASRVCNSNIRSPAPGRRATNTSTATPAVTSAASTSSTAYTTTNATVAARIATNSSCSTVSSGSTC